MNDQNLPMTAADWSWLFAAKPQVPAGDPMQLASAAPAPMPPVRPASLAPVAAAPAAAVPMPPPRPADLGPFGGLPAPSAMSNLAANPASGADAAALLRSRQPYGSVGFTAPSQDADTKAKMMALIKRGLISPEQIAAMMGP